MATPLTVNGNTYQFPQQFDKNWGPTVTLWATAVTNGMLQLAGGSFPLTAEVDFGSSFGLKAKYLKSEEASIASAGILRLANASTGINWRNHLDSLDLALTVNSSDQLTFNGTAIGATTSLANGSYLIGNVSNVPTAHALSGDITSTNAGVITIANSAITNVKVDAAAAIAVSKLAALTVSKAVVTDSSGVLGTSSTTSTELGYVHGVTSAIQDQINTFTTVPIGTVWEYAGVSAPSGWLMAQGQAVSRATYSALFAVISTTYGSGDGSTTFNLPDKRGRVSVGSGQGPGLTNWTIGTQSGEETHLLISSEMPSHTHSVTDAGHIHSVTDPGHTHSLTVYQQNVSNGTNPFATTDALVNGTTTTASQTTGVSVNSHTTGITNANTGGGGAHNNLQPLVVTNFIIKT